jgi:hypothetical protein
MPDSAFATELAHPLARVAGNQNLDLTAPSTSAAAKISGPRDQTHVRSGDRAGTINTRAK